MRRRIRFYGLDVCGCRLNMNENLGCLIKGHYPGDPDLGFGSLRPIYICKGCRQPVTFDWNPEVREWVVKE